MRPPKNPSPTLASLFEAFYERSWRSDKNFANFCGERRLNGTAIESTRKTGEKRKDRRTRMRTTAAAS